MVTTPNMSLTKWNSTSDFFSHAQLAANWDAVDAHDHTAGKGPQIPLGGLAAGAVNSNALADDAVITSKILNSQVTNAKLATDAVTTAKIQDGQITNAKVAADTLDYARLAKDASGLAVESFFAYRASSDQSVNSATDTVIVFNTEHFDLNGRYNVSNGRYTPQVKGIYEVSASVHVTSLADAKVLFINLNKNGAQFCRLHHTHTGVADSVGLSGTALVPMNGTTDFLEIILNHNHGSARNVTAAATAYTFFCGRLLGRQT